MLIRLALLYSFSVLAVSTRRADSQTALRSEDIYAKFDTRYTGASNAAKYGGRAPTWLVDARLTPLRVILSAKSA
jgi:hypothetical protein